MSGTPRVNLDVVQTIISYLNRRSLLNLSLTCKLYHTLALKSMLSSKVTIRTNSNLVGFCAFILADVSIRGPWVRSLVIHRKVVFRRHLKRGVVMDVSCLSSLAAILLWCKGLSSFHMSCMAESIKACPMLGHSIASLTSLKELVLSESEESPLVLELLRNMKSRLRRLQLEWYNPDFPWSDAATYESLAHLEVLKITELGFPPSNAHYFSWPTVREFVASYCRFSIEQLAIIFPNLQSCRLFNGIVEHRRELPSWPSLDHLEVADVHFDHLPWNGCPTRWLSISDLLGLYFNPHTVIDLVNECQPLLLNVEGCSINNLDFWSMLRTAAPSLRYLCCTFNSPLVFDHPGFLVSRAPQMTSFLIY